ncbi:MAG: hypothetical protein IPK18_08480 [Sphingobacteriales bacterium]|nr:MAG: hypothetical protein IPK18_08480 [Sphingobacteriales bacterium]
MDTIGLILTKENAPNTSFMEEIPAYLTSLYNNGDIVYNYNIPTIKGKLGNFDVSITDDSVKIKNGSLQKFIDKNNISPFGLNRIKQAFELLADTIHLPINNAKVLNFDFAKPITLKHDVSLYLNYFGNLNHFKRLEQPTGINYKNGYRELCIYNKITELKNHREFIPPLYQNANLIRLEMRYKRNLCKYFNVPAITPKILTNEDFYINLCNDLYNNYTKIDKLKTFKIDMSNITTKEQYKKLGVLKLIEEQGGKLEALKGIEERSKKGILTRKQKGDLIKLINECSQMKLQTIESELITELNQKVKESIKYYR